MRELSYADLISLTDEMAGRLRALGLQVGDRVGLLGVNSVEWVVAFLACLDLGLIAAPLNYRLSPSELRDQLATLGARLVLVDDELLDSVAGQSHTPVRTLTGSPADERSINSVAAISHEPVDSPAGAPALISFTSGSTGSPKGAVISHGALVLAARAYEEVLETTDQDRTLVLGPLFHNTGFCDQLAQMILVGGAVDLLPAFSTAAARDALRRRPATYLIAVPGILRLLATGPDAGALLGACRIGCYGGSPMPPAWIEDLRARWPDLRLHNCYGLTEFTSVSHILAPRDLPDHHDSVGRPVAGVQQRIVDPQGREQGPGEPGRLLLAGPTRMTRLLARARAHAERVLRPLADHRGPGIDRRRGLSAGARPRFGCDQPRRREDQPAPGGVRAGPGGAGDRGRGRRGAAPDLRPAVVAFVRMRNGGELDVERTRRQLLEQVADYAVPERFFVVDELPRNAAGKVDRHELRRYAQTAVESETQP